MRLIRLFPLLLLTALLAVPAHAQTLSLLCAWPKNPCCDTIYDIDLASGRVTWRSTRANSPTLGPATAQITDQRISWNWQFAHNRRGVDNFVIDRIRGISTVCGPDPNNGKYECMDPQPCEPTSSVKPKF